MKLLIPTALIPLLIAGCIGCETIVQKPIKLDFTCLSSVTKNGLIRTDCADLETWKEFNEKVMRERGV